jgi:hypothetical protein
MEKLAVLIVSATKNPKKNSKKFKLHPHHPINTTPRFEPKSLSYQFIFTLLTHIMSSSSSSEMKDQIAMAFLGVLDQTMSIPQAEEAASSST